MISVVMPCYREPKDFFIQALESILTQTYSDIEVVVVMDGYNSVLDEVLKEYSQKDNRISYHINGKNMGIAYSLNKGIGLAKGEYIARMDSDDIALSDRFEKELKYLKDNDLDFVSTYCEAIHEDGSHFRIMGGPSKTERIYTELRRRDCMWHPTWFLKKSVYEKLGGYAELMYAEDYHFLLKACKSGIKLGVLPECCQKYRVRDDSESHERAGEFYATAIFLQSHYDDIFEVTPEDLEEYLNSKEGQAVISETRQYLTLSGKFKKAGIGKLWYGTRMFLMPQGRKALSRRLFQKFE